MTTINNTGNLLRKISLSLITPPKIWGDGMLISFTVVIILLLVCISNHHVSHPKYIQFLLIEIK